LANNYQWYLNGELLNNANDSYLVPQQAGNYSVSSAFGSCLSESVYSNPQLLIPVIKATGISLYPNPASDELTIEVIESFIGKTYQIYSSSGELVKKGKLDSIKNQIALTKLPTGIYSLKVLGLQESIRFVKK
jgi:hypothetical protein